METTELRTPQSLKINVRDEFFVTAVLCTEVIVTDMLGSANYTRTPSYF